MNLEAIYFISQVVAAAALIGSLIFVGIQIRQVSQSQIREAVLNREANVVEGMNEMASKEYGELMLRGMRDAETLTDVELSRLYYSVGAFLVSTRARFQEKRQGLLTEEQWQSLKANIEFMLTSPGFRALFVANRETSQSDPAFDAEFADALSTPPNNLHEKVITRVRELNFQYKSPPINAEPSGSEGECAISDEV